MQALLLYTGKRDSAELTCCRGLDLSVRFPRYLQAIDSYSIDIGLAGRLEQARVFKMQCDEKLLGKVEDCVGQLVCRRRGYERPSYHRAASSTIPRTFQPSRGVTVPKMVFVSMQVYDDGIVFARLA